MQRRSNSERDAPLRTAFFSIAAQSDNLGDVDIRKRVAEWITSAGGPMTVFVGTMPSGYVECFRLPAHARLVSRPAVFQWLLMRSVVRRRAALIFAPGPLVLGKTVKSALKSLVNLANVRAVGLSGGPVLAVGRAFRGSGRLTRAIDCRSIPKFDLFVVRDTSSAQALGIPLRDGPDLAFEGPVREPGGTRGRSVVISLRADREINAESLGRSVAHLKRLGWEPIFISQVRRDDSQHEQLAQRFDCRAILWRDRSHVDQFALIEKEYSSAHAVVTNRLHALIFGLRAGCLGVAVVDGGSNKLTATMSGRVVVPTVVAENIDLTGESSADFWTSGAEVVRLETYRQVQACSVELRTLRREFVDILAR